MASTIILSDNGASSGSAGLKQTAGNDGVLILQTTTSGGTATNAIYVDNNQNSGFGGVTPSAWGSSKAVQVNGGTSLWNYATTNSYFGNNYYYNGSNRVYYSTAAAGEYSIQGSTHLWYGASSGTAGSTFSLTQLMTVDKGKTLALEGTTSATGTGITFPATQSASTNANTLDDYEEGSWTPYLGGTSSDPTGVTYAAQYGYYIKVGRIVTITMYFNTASTGTGGSGDLIVKGLPFTAASGSGGTYSSMQTEIYGINNPSNATGVFARLNPGSTGFTVEWFYSVPSQAIVSIGAVPISTSYRTANFRLLTTYTYMAET